MPRSNAHSEVALKGVEVGFSRGKPKDQLGIGQIDNKLTPQKFLAHHLIGHRHINAIVVTQCDYILKLPLNCHELTARWKPGDELLFESFDSALIQRLNLPPNNLKNRFNIMGCLLEFVLVEWSFRASAISLLEPAPYASL